jgi:hypothetical protein
MKRVTWDTVSSTLKENRIIASSFDNPWANWVHTYSLR